MKRCYLLLWTFFFFITAAIAQTGSLQGRVTTADGNPAVRVTILLEKERKGTVTDENGRFEFKRLPAGEYELKISLIGYESLTHAVSVRDEQATQVDLQLHVSDKQLEEVVIRSDQKGYKVSRVSPALRLQTPLIEVPQNIQVVTGKVIADQQIFDMLEGVTRNVSGMTRVEHWDNYARIYMRGSNTVAFRNGMNTQMPWGPLAEDMSMIDRIEFVKGPAGFMMANGEPGGLYNVVTKKPSGFNKGEFNFTYGSFNTFRAAADLDGKLTRNGRLLYRLNLMTSSRESHRKYEYTRRHTIAPVLKYVIDDKTSVTAEYTYQFLRMSTIGSSYVFSTRGYADLPRNFTIAEPNIKPSDMNDHSALVVINRTLTPHWKLTGQFAWFHYSQVGSSLWYDSIKTNGDLYRSLGIWDALGENKVGQVYLNGDFRSGAVKHNVLAGIDAGKKDYWADWSQTYPLQGPAVFNIYHPVYGVPDNFLPVFDRSGNLKDRAAQNYGVINSKYGALYVQDELQLFDNKLRLTLAGRYTISEQSDYGGEAYKGNKFTPRAGLSYSLNQSASVYALYDQAFVPQSGRSRTNELFKPITGGNIEAGLKKDWLGSRWNTTLSVYQITRNNVLTPDPADPNYSVQLGQTKATGVELDVRGELLEGLNLTLNYAYTDSRITKDEVKANEGNATPGTTRHVTNGWLSYRLPDGVLKGAGISFGYQWQVKRFSWYVWDNSEAALPDYFRADGAVSWSNDKYNVALNVNNIFNKYLYSGSPYAGSYYWQTEPGTNFRFTLGYRF